MRLVFLIFTLVMFFGCKDQTKQTSIVGSWTLENVIDKSGLNITDKHIFLPNDSLIIEISSNGKIEEKYLARYKFIQDSGLVYTMMEDTSFKFEIIKLTEKILETKQVGTNRLDRYKRLK